MKTCRTLLFATLVVFSSLFTFQHAGASALMASDKACDDIGPLPYRVLPVGFKGSDRQATLESSLRSVPACLNGGDSADDTANSAGRSCNIIGPTASAPMSSSSFVSTCMVAPNLRKAPAVNDDRVCDTGGVMMKQSHSCVTTD